VVRRADGPPPPERERFADPPRRDVPEARSRADDASELSLDALEEVIGGLERAWITPGGHPGPPQSGL
jgi:hypothetical protein